MLRAAVSSDPCMYFINADPQRRSAVAHIAQEFLLRRCPQWAAQIQFETTTPEDAENTSSGSPWEVSAVGGNLVVRGSTPLAQAAALRCYLEDAAGMCLAYSGPQQRITFTLRKARLPLPKTPLQGVLPAHPRAALSPQSFGYSPCWWDLERWQDEIDILAMYGTTEALLLIGSDYVWFQALREEDISTGYIMGTMSAPQFWPRQLQGHFDSVLPPVDPLFLKARGQLGRSIADRMRAWGITPVLPAFTGTVSAQLQGVLKGAKYLPQPAWYGYPSVYQLDPACAVYARLQAAYDKHIALVFGGPAQFWNPAEELAGQVLPPEGRTVLHGNAANAAAQCRAAACRADDPEYNPLLYTLHMESLTRTAPAELDAWLKAYAARRYGNEAGYEALRLLCDCSYNQDSPAPGSVFCMRPAMSLEPSGPGDAIGGPDHSADLFRSAALLLELDSRLPGWHYDLCDILRQALSDKARTCYLQAMQGFFARDSHMFERGANDFLGLLEDCDRLLRCEQAFCLSYHLERAGSCAKMDAEKNNFELGFLLQHSIYGAGGVKKKRGYQLYGMAWREWGGLLDSLCSRRWRGFFKQLAAHFGDKKFSLETKEKPLGRTAYMGNKFYDQMAAMELEWMRGCTPDKENPEDLRVVAQELCRKYQAEITQP